MDRTPRIIVCTNARPAGQPSCGAAGAEAIIPALQAALEAAGVSMRVEAATCLGLCSAAPNLRLVPGGAIFNRVDPADLDDIVAEARRFQAEKAEA